MSQEEAGDREEALSQIPQSHMKHGYTMKTWGVLRTHTAHCLFPPHGLSRPMRGKQALALYVR